jgi:rod shape-determining protein MreC
MAAQVIGTSGSEQSRSVYIDKGEVDGLKPDTAVITADGVVGKVLLVYRSTSLVLLISDHSSGVGAILEKSRIEGIVRGTPAGEVMLEKVMSDEAVSVGEQVLTSGGDGIFPKGLLVGTVTKVTPGSELFLNIHLRPAADLSKLEEVLVVTKIDERQAEPEKTGAARAVDILAERLPTVPSKPENAEKGPAPETATPKTAIPKTVAPANAGLDTKPKAASSDALTSSGAPATRKPATSASSPVHSSGNPSGAASAVKPAPSGIDATKLSEPAKATAEPKPQPAVEEIPH